MDTNQSRATVTLAKEMEDEAIFVLLVVCAWESPKTVW